MILVLISEALGNAAAERLAAKGCAGLSHQINQPSPLRARAPRYSLAGSSLVRAQPRRRRRLRSR